MTNYEYYIKPYLEGRLKHYDGNKIIPEPCDYIIEPYFLKKVLGLKCGQLECSLCRTLYNHWFNEEYDSSVPVQAVDDNGRILVQDDIVAVKNNDMPEYVYRVFASMIDGKPATYHEDVCNKRTLTLEKWDSVLFVSPSKKFEKNS